MITEDYVSFETAKLLKEKGFDWEVNHYYYSQAERLVNSSSPLNWNDSGVENEYSAPTLAVAQKWLKEKHNLSVEVCRSVYGYVGCITSISNGTEIRFIEEPSDDLLSNGQFAKWEDACEATIKYCLEKIVLSPNSDIEL